MPLQHQQPASNKDVHLANIEEVLDRLTLAATRLDENDRFIYANRPALDWLGTTMNELQGRSLWDIVPQDCRGRMREQIGKRQRGEGDTYETELIRPKDGKRVPVSIAGVPMVDKQNNYFGAVGIFRDLQFDKVAEAVHKRVETCRDGQELLASVAADLRGLIPYDFFCVGQYSRDLNHVATLFEYPSDVLAGQEVRWWPYPPEFKPEICLPRVEGDFEALMQRPSLAPFLRYKSVSRFVGLGFRSFVRMPIFRGDRPIAYLALFSKGRDRYSDKDLDLLRRLPVEKAVHMAFHYRDVDELEFRHRLLREIVKCKTVGEVASLLTRQLCSHYSWQHAMVFRVDEAQHRFVLVAQHCQPAVEALTERFSQDISTGVLGHVYRSQGRVNLDNVRRAVMQDIDYHEIRPEVTSEMCFPIEWDGKVRWLLNIEDVLESAFSKDEEELLGTLVKEIEPLLGRLCRGYFLASAFEKSTDAFLMTDSSGNIVEANRASADLLGFSTPAELRRPVKEIFADEKAASAVTTVQRTSPTRMLLRGKDGSQVPVLLTSADLPEQIGGKFISAADLTLQERLEKLEGLGEMFYEIAIQTRTPLALAQSWLSRLSRETNDTVAVDVIGKTLQQLNKVQITEDRLALYDADRRALVPTRKTRLDVAVQLKRVLVGFPESERAKVDVSDGARLPYVLADPTQISFVFQTILSYLVRFLARDERIEVRFSHSESWVKVRISGSLPSDNGAASEAEQKRARARFDMALGAPVIRAFLENHAAKYQGQPSDDARACFTIDFPVAEEGAVR